LKNKYFEGIDGLRFYVFLLILINHTGVWYKSQGHTFFFMLSGFLIGYSSFNDISKYGVFSLKRYLLRRILRTFPLYYLILLFCGGCYLILDTINIQIDLGNYWSYFLFLQNYFRDDGLFILKNLWAMAVTEQLYLAWGLLIFFLQKRIVTYIVLLLLFFVAAAFILNIVSSKLYENTLIYAGIYLLGAYGGLLFHRQDRLLILLGKLKKWQGSLLLIFSLLLIIVGLNATHISFVLHEYILAFSFFWTILVICYSRTQFKFLLNHAIVKYLGRISYGLYCYHALVITAITHFFFYFKILYSSIFLFSTSLIFTILIAVISYEFYEKKFLKMKRSLR